MAERKRGPGRPPRAGKAALDRLELRITADERRAWLKAAGGSPLGVWLREAGNRAAGEAS